MRLREEALHLPPRSLPDVLRGIGGICFWGKGREGMVGGIRPGQTMTLYETTLPSKRNSDKHLIPKVKYLGYLARIVKRLYNELKLIPLIRLIIIYTADVEKGSTSF